MFYGKFVSSAVNVQRFCIAVATLFLASCGEGNLRASTSGDDPIITSAALSPDASQVVMTVDRYDSEVQHLLIYDIHEDRFRVLPDLHGGWVPMEPAFSNDQTKIALAAYCRVNCSDLNDQSRLYVFDLERDRWDVVLSGKGWRSQPRFLPGDRELLYVTAGLLGSVATNDLLPIDPEPARLTLSTGETTRYSLENPEFYVVMGPKLGPGPAIYFVASGPENKDLQENIEKFPGADSVTSLIPYYIPVTEDYRQYSPGIIPEISGRILSSTLSGEVGQLEASGDGARVVFSVARVAQPRQFGEQYFILENGLVQESIFTTIQAKRFSLSRDGNVALILGDPERRGFRGGRWDIYLVNLETEEIRPVPILDRVGAVISEYRDKPFGLNR